jgi:MFS family permease
LVSDGVKRRLVAIFAAITTMARMSIPRWRVFGAACLAHVLHDGYSSMLYLLLPFWQRELALSLTQVGILKTVYSAAMAFGQVPAGRLGERWSERLPLAAGTLLTAAAVVALHWATTPLVLGLLLAIGGLGASVQHPLASTLISKVYGGPTLRVTVNADQAVVADQVVSDGGKQTSAARLLTAGMDKPLEIIEPTRKEAMPVEGGSKAK